MPGPVYGPVRIALVELETDGMGHFGGALRLIRPDGGDVRDLVFPTPALNIGVDFVAFSPDNTKIAYIWRDSPSPPDFVFSIRYVNAEGGSPTIVHTFPVGFNAVELGLSWSPDATRFVFARINIGTGNVEWCVVNIDGTGLTVIHTETFIASNAISGKPLWSPDGAFIVFTTNVGPTYFDNKKICRINPDGTGLADITDGSTTDDVALDFFENGLKLLVARDIGPGDGVIIATMNIDGTAWTSVFDDSTGTNFVTVGDGSLSPEEDRIVLARSDNRDLCTVNIDGTGFTAIPTTGVHGESSPDWDGPVTGPAPTPSSGRVVFERQDYGASPITYEIWAVDLDGQNLTQLTTDSTSDPGNVANETPSWSPDGSQIVWWKWGAFDQIWIMDADGSSPTMLHDAPADAYNLVAPSISPDGTVILFASLDYGSGTTRIATIPIGGGSLTILDDGTGGNATDPRWSPDGSKVAYVVNGNQVFTCNPDGSGRIALMGAAVDEVNLQHWLPDGTALLVTAVVAAAPLVLATVDATTGALTPFGIAEDLADLNSSAFLNRGRVAWRVNATDMLCSELPASGDRVLADRLSDGTGFPFEVT